MIVRYRLAIAVGVAALTVGTALGVSGAPERSSSVLEGQPMGKPVDDATTNPSEGPSGSETADGHAQDGRESRVSSPPSGAATPKVRGGAESQPDPSASPSGLPGLGGSRHRPQPVKILVPHKGSMVKGRLVAAYPSSLLPAAPRSRVLSSSVSPAGDRIQVALVARPGSADDAVFRFYRQILSLHGFVEESVPAVGGSRAAAFAKGDSSVVVTAIPGRVRSYSVYATLTGGRV